MSATNRGATVVTNEFYPTPSYTVQALLNELDFTKYSSFHEPCKGSGAILDLIPSKLIKSHCELTEGTDYLSTSVPPVDLIITNPPFSLAQKFITKSLTEANTVIYLLRLNYLGSQARKKFWGTNPPTHLFVLAKRPKFVAKCSNKTKTDGVFNCTNKQLFQITNPPQVCSCGKTVSPASDATEYAWFVWDKTNSIPNPPGIYVI